MIACFDDFCRELIKAGFSMGGGNDEGVFALINFGWDSAPEGSKIAWHTGDVETDPWEWRIRVLEERSDIAYGKIFFRKSGFITKQWYPYFLAARRGGKVFEEMYEDGVLSNYAKRVFEIVSATDAIAVHEIKPLLGISKEDNAKFERALIELQMGLFITMCGRRQKVSSVGQEYGWASTMFCTTEKFWGNEIFDNALKISKAEAETEIASNIYMLNPNAQPKKISKFIYGK